VTEAGASSWHKCLGQPSLIRYGNTLGKLRRPIRPHDASVSDASLTVQLGQANQTADTARDIGDGGARADGRAVGAGAGAGRWTHSAAFTPGGEQ